MTQSHSLRVNYSRPRDAIRDLHPIQFWATRMLMAAAMLSSLFAAAPAQASHFRAANLSWSVPNPSTAPRTVRFKLEASWATGSGNQTISLSTGDGQAAASLAPTFIGSGTDSTGEGFDTYSYTGTYTYPGNGPYDARWTSCCFVDGLSNASDDWSVTATVSLGGGNTAGPSSSVPGLVQLPVDAASTLLIGAVDADGDQIGCTLAADNENGLGTTVPSAGGNIPTVAPASGGCLVSWDTSAASVGQRYVLGVFISSTKGGAVSRSHIITIVEIVGGTPPSCTGGGTVTTDVGAAISRVVTGTDANGANLTLSSIGLPSGATLMPTAGASPLASTLAWTPGQGASGTTTLVSLTFTNPSNLSTFCPVAIVVRPECGNNVIETGETCDDGNKDGMDGCSPICRFEVCGSGYADYNEGCDDGGTSTGDGCSAGCTVEPGFRCTGVDPSVCAPDPCSNGVIDTGETCDDGNNAAGDGCSSMCTLEPGYNCPTPGAACTDINECLTNNGGCGAASAFSCTNNPGPVPTCTDIDECATNADNCSDDATCTNTSGSFNCACNPGYSGNGVFCTDINECTVETDNCSANGTCTNTTGSFTCACNTGYAGNGVTCSEICGDGLIVGAETCDDSNTANADGCSGTCVVEVGWLCGGQPSDCGAALCGDGLLADIEVCDDGNAQSGDGCSAVCVVEPGWECTDSDNSTCSAVACGDGVTAGAELCDDGNTQSDDGCSAACAVEPGFTCTGAPSTCAAGSCGNGLLEGAEQCDDGDATGGDGCSSACAVESGFQCTGTPSDCVAARCGDGIVAGLEACDDRNAVAGDGCSPTCTIEAGWGCAGRPSACTASECGDGVVAGAEECDDDDVVAGDGCAADCKFEPGFTCSGSPSTCEAGACGDGVVTSLEGCDDGNRIAGDGCSPQCRVEGGYTCDNQSASICTATACGDGIRVAAEFCDDGNTAEGDGCSSSCSVEPGWRCTGSLSSCAADSCGDGKLAGAEACDDSNNVGGDGCAATCVVEKGYSCLGGTCVDVNECMDDEDNCSSDAACANTTGSFTCTCNSGFAGNGVTCTDIDECLADNGGCGNATFYRCTNNVGVAPTCADIDECLADNGGCGNATFYRCTNNTGAAPTCADIDECATNNGGCGAASAYSCTNNVGAAPSCTDINECTAGTHNCSSQATCRNRTGSFRCTCNAGYSGDGVTCSDVNECTAGTANCGVNTVCTNATGSFACVSDVDADGIPDSLDRDADNDGIDNETEGKVDTDGDGIPDWLDVDSDNDGLTDAFEAGAKDDDGDGRVDDIVDDNGDGLDDSRGDAAKDPRDSDDDGVPDYRDLDSDGDGISDVEESGNGALDEDRDGRIDDKTDNDKNGLPDNLDPGQGNGPATRRDTDEDGTPDYLDPDSDGDGIDDKTERLDTDGDGAPDIELRGDADGNGLDDALQGGDAALDTDEDGVPNYEDADDDGDGVATADELGDSEAAESSDIDGDGIPNYLDDDADGDSVPDGEEVDGDRDRNQDGIPDYLQPWVNNNDEDGDGIVDWKERASSGDDLDTDGDGIPDVNDDDDDGDGVGTRVELGEDQANPRDSDNDGTPDFHDTDDDGDGILTLLENAGSIADMDGDGIPNYLDTDSDGDGYSDALETRVDADKNGVPDYLEPPSFGVSGGAGCSVGQGPGTEDLGSGLYYFFALSMLAYRARSRKGRTAAALWLLVALTAGSSAHAQGFSLNAYRNPPLPSDGLMLQSPGTLHAKQWSLGANLDYANDPLVLESRRGVSESESTSIVGNQLNGHLAFGYGIVDRLSVFGVMNVVMLEQGQRAPMPGSASPVRLADGPGLGDARFGARFRLLGARQHDSFGLGIQAAVVAPLAELADKSQNFRGERAVAGDFALLASFDLRVLRVGASVGTRLRQEVQFLGLRLGNELTFGLGAALPLLGDRLALLAEAQINTGLNNTAFTRTSTPAELLFGLRANVFKSWRLNVGAGPGVSRGLGAPDFRMIAGVMYAAAAPDTPVMEPEVEVDSDPDNDDVIGTGDRCPQQAEDRDNFEDQDGCPDEDNDADGIPDATDMCADEAEDRDGFEDADGCADKDDDHDGIDDSQDACPREAEDKDGVKDSDGCPDPDRDGDGIEDAEDKCPTIAGDAEHGGCSTQVSIEQNQIRISQRVEFATGSAELLASSDAILSVVKSVLDINPEIRVTVQGHTDARGAANTNLQLSKRRAASVMSWLVHHGIASDRLAAAGCGEAQPLTMDKTPNAQQQNRRVEFHMIDPAGPQGQPQGCEAAQ
jgi:cysteine-rich repeat protein